MTDVEGKTPTKRKNFSNAENKKNPAKKVKLDGRSPQQGVLSKQQKKKGNKQNGPQKINQKNKKNSNSGVSPKQLKPFPGTQAVAEQTAKNKKGDGVEGAEGRKKKRRNGFQNLGLKIRSGDKEEALSTIEQKIKDIESRKEVTKTGKRKLRLLVRMKRFAEGNAPEPQQQKASNVKSVATKREGKKKAANQISGVGEPAKAVQKGGKAKANGKPNKNVQAQNTKAAKKTIPQQQVEEEEDSDEVDSEEDESDEVQQGEESSGEESGDEEESEDSDEQNVEEGESDEDDSEEEDSSPPPKVKKSNFSIIDLSNDQLDTKVEPAKDKIVIKNVITFKKKNTDKEENNVDLEQLKKNDLIAKNQKRFVLFVGNIPYDTTKFDLMEHFKKNGEIKDVRLPTEKNGSRPRGFAYLELPNEESYQKCLSMHHTFLKGRRINVLYTQGGKKKGELMKKQIKTKNFKLHAMRKQGKLAGSVKETQKRSFRRAKQQSKKSENERQE